MDRVLKKFTSEVMLCLDPRVVYNGFGHPSVQKSVKTKYCLVILLY